MDLFYMFFKGRVSEKFYVVMGVKERVVVFSCRVCKFVRISDVFLKSVEVVDNFRVEVILVDYGGYGRNN